MTKAEQAVARGLVWSRDGRELFYIDAGNVLTAVPVQTPGPTFAWANRSALIYGIRMFALPASSNRESRRETLNISRMRGPMLTTCRSRPAFRADA